MLAQSGYQFVLNVRGERLPASHRVHGVGVHQLKDSPLVVRSVQVRFHDFNCFAGYDTHQYSTAYSAWPRKFRFCGSTPCRYRTKKSCSFPRVIGELAPWLAPGIITNSKSFRACTSAFTSRNVDSGGTLLSSSPTTSCNRPCSLAALSIFEHSEYCGPTG